MPTVRTVEPESRAHRAPVGGFAANTVRALGRLRRRLQHDVVAERKGGNQGRRTAVSVDLPSIFRPPAGRLTKPPQIFDWCRFRAAVLGLPLRAPCGRVGRAPAAVLGRQTHGVSARSGVRPAGARDERPQRCSACGRTGRNEIPEAHLLVGLIDPKWRGGRRTGHTPARALLG